MNMMLSQHLVSSDYSLCVSQIYISVCNFIILRKSSSLHSYFEFMCHYRVSESFYAYKHTERCIETFLCYFYNNDYFKEMNCCFTRFIIFKNSQKSQNLFRFNKIILLIYFLLCLTNQITAEQKNN